MSPSSRGRGLKYVLGRKVTMYTIVALFTRAWIEIYPQYSKIAGVNVALFARAWIEIVNQSIIPFSTISRPLHEGVD